MTRTYRKPAEVHLEDGSFTAEHVDAQLGYLFARQYADDPGQYIPWHRVRRVQRLPAGSSVSSDVSGEETDETSDAGDAAAVADWLETDVGIPGDEFDVFVHEEYGSVNVEPDGSVDWWSDATDAIRELDDAWWDGDDRAWVIRDPSEVPG